MWNYYDKEYYEKASGIKLPETAQSIESFDNGEFYTITSFKLSSGDMHSLIKQYAFKGIEKNYRPTLFGVNNLKKDRPKEDLFANYVYLMRSKDKLNSTYLIDTVKNLLWASITYPDWGGH